MAAFTTLGATSALVPASNIAHTMTGAAPSNSKLLASFGWSGAVSLTSVTGGGVTWVIVGQARSGTSNCGLAYADAPSGQSAVAVTGNFSGGGSTGSRFAGVAYATGMPLGDPILTGQSSGSGTAWTISNLAALNNDVLFGIVYEADGFNNTTNTPSTNNNEIHDIALSADSMMADEWRQPTADGTVTVQGTLSNTSPWVSYGALWGSRTPYVNADYSAFPKVKLQR